MPSHEASHPPAHQNVEQAWNRMCMTYGYIPIALDRSSFDESETAITLAATPAELKSEGLTWLSLAILLMLGLLGFTGVVTTSAFTEKLSAAVGNTAVEVGMEAR